MSDSLELAPEITVKALDKSPPLTSKQGAIENLKEVKEKVLAYAGKDGYNPYLWLQQRGVDRLLTLLNLPDASQEDIKSAYEIQYEEPSIDLFASLYEPKPKNPTSRK